MRLRVAEGWNIVVRRWTRFYGNDRIIVLLKKSIDSRGSCEEIRHHLYVVVAELWKETRC